MHLARRGIEAHATNPSAIFNSGPFEKLNTSDISPWAVLYFFIAFVMFAGYTSAVSCKFPSALQTNQLYR